MNIKNAKIIQISDICIVSLAISFAIYLIGYILRLGFYNVVLSKIKDVGLESLLSYFAHVFFLLVLFVYAIFAKNDRKHIFCFCNCKFKKNLVALFIGVLLGFILNSICAIFAHLNNDISIEFLACPNLLFLFIAILAVFIQSSTEEIAFRGLLMGRLKENNVSLPLVIFVSSIGFSATHIFNPYFEFLEFFNIFTIGVFLALLYCVTGSIWTCFGFHTAWNYTQDYIFGLANSGNESLLSIATTTINKNSFFFNTDFGIEGSMMCAVVNIISIVVLCVVLCIQKNNIKNKLFNL